MVRGRKFTHVRLAKNKGKKDKYYFVKYRGTPKQEPPVSMPDDIDSPEFLIKWRVLMGLDIVIDKTFKTLIENYQISEEYLSLSTSTQKFYNTYLNRVLKNWGAMIVADLKPSNVLYARDEMSKKHGRGSANNYLTTLKNLISWGVPREFADFNPCDDINPYKKGEGYQPWSNEAIEFWRNNANPIFVLAMEYALYLGQRQADVLKIQISDYENGLFRIKQNKGRKYMAVPLHPDLIPIDLKNRQSIALKLEASKSVVTNIQDDAPILTNYNGTAWTINSFKSAWNKEKNKPEMKWFKETGFVFHGLRKNAVVNLLEAGCTPDEVKAITGHETTAMVEHYGKGVNQRKQARSAIAKIEDYRNKNR